MATHALSPAAVPAYRGGLYEWLTTTDHKKIGIMYVINSFLFFLIGGIFALLVRTELAAPGIQLFTNEHVYNEAFSLHATVMIFLFIIPMLAGLGNYAVPLMIGAPDMAFPRINALSFWMLPLGGILLLSGFLTPGGAAAAGWTSYPPLSERGALSSPGPGQDLWIVSRKPLFAYKAFIFATAAIGALGFSVWAHHMFTTGAVFLPFFSLMTFLIAVPTGVKMFNWVFTMFRGQLTFSTPLIFAIGFLTMFLIGGINGAFI